MRFHHILVVRVVVTGSLENTEERDEEALKVRREPLFTEAERRRRTPFDDLPWNAAAVAHLVEFVVWRESWRKQTIVLGRSLNK